MLQMLLNRMHALALDSILILCEVSENLLAKVIPLLFDSIAKDSCSATY